MKSGDDRMMYIPKIALFQKLHYPEGIFSKSIQAQLTTLLSALLSIISID